MSGILSMNNSIFLLFLYEKFYINIAMAGCKSSTWWCTGQCRDTEGHWVTQFCDGKQSERLTKKHLEFPMELSIHEVNAIWSVQSTEIFWFFIAACCISRRLSIIKSICFTCIFEEHRGEMAYNNLYLIL